MVDFDESRLAGIAYFALRSARDGAERRRLLPHRSRLAQGAARALVLRSVHPDVRALPDRVRRSLRQLGIPFVPFRRQTVVKNNRVMDE
jgi:hypothetical protein